MNKHDDWIVELREIALQERKLEERANQLFRVHVLPEVRKAVENHSKSGVVDVRGRLCHAISGDTGECLSLPGTIEVEFSFYMSGLFFPEARR
jgi:hypothetical protein